MKLLHQYGTQHSFTCKYAIKKMKEIFTYGTSGPDDCFICLLLITGLALHNHKADDSNACN